jgi:hypothetical protein
MYRGTAKAKDNFMKATVSGEALSRVDRQIFAASFAQQQSWVLELQEGPQGLISRIISNTGLCSFGLRKRYCVRRDGIN